MNQFLNICSLQYFFERIAKLEPESISSHLVFGKAIHNSIGYFYTHMKKGKRVKPEELAEVFVEDWKMETSLTEAPVLYQNRDDGAVLQERGRELVSFFASEAKDERVVSVEEQFEVPHHYSGRRGPGEASAGLF